MPGWLLRLLPYGIAVAIVLGAIWWIDRHAAERTRTQIEAAAAKLHIDLRNDLRASEKTLAAQIGAIDSEGKAATDAVDALHTTIIQPTIIKEMTREVRYTDPAAGIPDSVRGEINRALTAVACSPRADGGISCAVSAATGP